MHSLPESVKTYFSPPDFPDDEILTLRVRLLSALLNITIVLSILFLPLTYQAGGGFKSPNFLLTAGAGLVLTALRSLLRGKKIEAASLLFLLITLLPAMFLYLGFENGLRAPGYTAFLIANAIVASLLLKHRVALILIVFTLLVNLLVAIGESQGVFLTEIGIPDIRLVLVAQIVFVAEVYILLRYFLGNLEQLLDLIKHKERNRQEAEDRYRRLVSVISDYVFYTEFGDEGELKHDVLDGPFEEITGYTPEEFMTIGGWRATLHPDDILEDERALAQLRNNQSTTSEVRVKRKDGIYRWVRTYGRPVWDEEKNELRGIHGIVQDITDHKRAEEALKASESRFSKAFHANPVALALSTIDDGVLIDVNDTWLRLLGLKREEVIGRSVLDLGIYESPAARQELVDTLRKEGRVADRELKGISKDGTVLHGVSSWEVVEFDGKAHVLSMLYDISKLKQAEKALQASLTRQKTLLHAVPDMIFELTKDGVFVDFVPSLGGNPLLSPDQFIGKHLRDVMPDSVTIPALNAIQRAFQEKRIQSFEYELARDEGTGTFEARVTVSTEDTVLCIIRDATDTKRAQQSLLESEERYRSLFNKTPIGLFRSKPDGTIVDANPALVRMLGYPDRETLLKTNASALYLSPDQRKAWQEQMAQTESVENDPSPRRRYDDSIIWVDGNSHIVYADNGEIQYYEGSLRDVTQRKIAEEALRNSELRFRTLFDISRATSATASLHDLLAVVREELGKLLDTSDFYVALYDEATELYSFPYWVDRADTDPADWVSQPLTGSLTDYVRRTGRPLRSDRRHFDELVQAGEAQLIGGSSEIWLGVPLRTATGVIGAMVVQNYEDAGAYSDEDLDLLAYIAENIAWVIESKVAEAELQELNTSLEIRISERTRDFELAAEVSRQATQVLDLEDLIRSICQRTRDAFGLYHVSVLLYDGDADLLKFSAGSGGDTEGIFSSTPTFKVSDSVGLLVHAVRTRKPILANRIKESDLYVPSVYLPETRSDFVVPLLVGEQVIGVLNLEADQEDYFTADHERVMTSLGFQLAVAITNALRFEQLHQMNEELVKLDRLRSEFLASVSHELRTPLNAVINFNQFVSSGLHGPVNERQIDALNKSTNSARHLLSLINDVLDMSKIESGRLELFIEPDVDVSAELIEVAEITRSLIDQKPITVTLDLDTKIPLVRADKRRIRQVLLNITSNAVKFTDEGRITIGASTSGQEVIISVRDTGPGIPKDDHQRVFEAFHQLDRDSHATGGTGLGLAISKRLIEGQKGKLWLESIPGQGATFYVSMPVAKTAVKPNGDD